VADNLNKMGGLEDDVFTTALKEAAAIAYAGIDTEVLSPLTAHFLCVFSVV
jgi:hypothetical protein